MTVITNKAQKPKLFHCKANRCDMMPVACADRQRLIQSDMKIRRMNDHGSSAIQNFMHNAEACLKCKQGRKYANLQRPKRKDSMTRLKDKIENENIINNKENTMVNPNTCEKCGKTYNMKPDEDGRKFWRRKECYECEGKSEVLTPAPAPKTIQAPGTSYRPASKICAWEPCGKEFFQAENEASGNWSLRRYCGPGCQKAMENRRKRERKKEKAQIKAYDQTATDEAVSEIWSFIEDLISADKEPKFKLFFTKGFVLGAKFQAKKMGIEVE